LNKIYVGWNEGFMSSDYIGFVSLSKLLLVKKHINELDQNVIVKVFDLDTMEEMFECRCMSQQTDKSICHCKECELEGNEVTKYLKEAKKGNYWK